jgi:tRNA threonylcarbamoyladenosine biosynthesis protein TsaB
VKILVLDSSTSHASIAVAVDERIVAESVFSCDRSLSARLVPEIVRLITSTGLTLGDIDLFAASVGPGSFTGIRGGVATVQGLALATGKPCAGFSSLALLAMNFSLVALPVCPLLDARKSEVYAALYDCSAALPSPLIADCVLPPLDFLNQIISVTKQPVVFAGDGALRYRGLITEVMAERAIFAPFPLHTSHAANGTLLAHIAFQRGEQLEPSQLLPVYLRESDAVMMKNMVSVTQGIKTAQA